MTPRETFREANRELAKRYAAHLAPTEGFKKTTRHRWESRPDGFTQSDPVLPFLTRLTDGADRERGREFVGRVPPILALADYEIVEATRAVPAPEGGPRCGTR